MTEDAHELPAGTVFGRDFRILHKIAEGGMGEVYAAEQVSTRKTRALKLMHATLVHDARLRERFLQEAHASSVIESDHVAEVVAVGIDEATGVPWLAMELLRGETLARYVETHGPFSPRDLLELATQMRHVLAQAHAAKLVHRDLKPENLFIAQARRVGIPFTLKVLDFGIAKFVQETRSVANSQVIGSPLWMAPEQWQPRAPIGPATDVWALALVMFYALAGRAYWRTAQSDDIGRVVVEVVAEPIAPPSARARELGLGVEIPPGFDEWFLGCLARAPAERFPDADVALGRFEELFEGRPRSAGSVTFRSSAPPPEPIAPAPVVKEGVARLVETATLATAPDVLWKLAGTPLAGHMRTHRLLAALTPAIAEALSVDPVLVGLTPDLRVDRLAARTGTAERAAHERATRILRDVAERLGLGPIAVYARQDQREPLRIEPTMPLSYVLGPAVAGLAPPAVVFLCAAAAGVSKPDLVLRAIAPEVAQLRRIVAAATDMARGKASKVPRDMVMSVLRGHVAPSGELAEHLDADGDACTEEALAAWLVAVDCTLARIGLFASGRVAVAADALGVPPPMAVAPAIEAMLVDLDEWTTSGGYASARAAWGPPFQ